MSPSNRVKVQLGVPIASSPGKQPREGGRRVLKKTKKEKKECLRKRSGG